MLIALLQCSAKSFSQNVTLNENHVSLKKALQDISKQTGYVFFYESKDVTGKSVDVKLKNAGLAQALEECLEGQMLTYKIVGNTVILQQKEESSSQTNDKPVVPVTVSGQVLDQNGNGLAGVTISLRDGRTLAATGADGKFNVQVPDNQSVLVFSFVGYNKKELPITPGTPIVIKMEVATSGMNEVVVVGYGTSSKTNLATATSSVTAKEYQSAVVTTIDQALQGRASGVQVTETSGEPGADAVIRIRGNNSLSGDNQPLYVVDGFPLPPYAEAATSAAGSLPDNGLYGINPNDIESITVLKDAAATAIYGSRGANGVILIKTKSGQAGNSRIEFVDKTTFGTLNTPYKMGTPAEFADIVNQGYVLSAQPAPFTAANIAALPGSGTDWFKAITRTGVREDATLDVSGGNGKTNYYISGDYLNDKGAIIGADNNRASVRANLNSQVNNWYSLKAQLSIVRQNTARAISDSRSFPGSDGPVLDALRASPIVPVSYYGFDGEGIPGFTDGNLFSNPVSELTQKIDNMINDFDVVNFENDFKLAPGLQFVVNLGANQSLSRRQTFFPPTLPEGYAANGAGSNSMANTYSYNVNAYLNYDKTFNQDHQLNLTGGIEYNKTTVELLNTVSSGFDIPSYGIYNIGSADVQSVGSFRADRIIQSAFFRANYSYKERYVLNASIRLDGASPFAENKKYGTFPAAGFAWNLNREDFMKDVTVVTNTKLRVSYGETGSQAIGPYSSLAQYGNAFYQTGASNTVNTVLFPSSLGNANLSWERTKQLDAGIDFSLIRNFLNVSFDYFNKETDGLLQQRALPSQTGFTSVEDNYGSIRNRGLELTLSANVVKSGGFNYTTKIEISHNKNTLLNLGSITAPQYVSLGGNLAGGVLGLLQPGKEIGLFYGEKVTGLVQTSDIVNGVPKYAYPGVASNQVPGEWKYLDVNKDGVIDANDREVLGKANPDFTYGWNNDISYKNFSLNLFFTGSQGNDILNLTRYYLSDGTSDYAGIFFNQTQDWFDHHWTPSNPTNDPRYPGVQKNISLADINSSMIENGSYFRLKSATIAYSLPATKIFKNARIFFTGTNVFTITKYTGNDPEVGSYGQSLLQQGIDYGAYPSNRSYTIGVSTNF